jgi:hypothetical protein
MPFFYPQLLKIAAAMASWVTVGKRQVLYRHDWSFKPKYHYKSLLVPYLCKLQQRFRPSGRSSATACNFLLDIEKSSSQLFSSL